MKKIIKTLSIIALIVNILILTGCKNLQNDNKKSNGSVIKSDTIKINGFAIDNSYKDEKSEDLKMLYIFCEVTAKKANLKVSSKLVKLTINNTNSYESEKYVSKTYMPNYYYSDYLKDIYVGSSQKLLLTFKVPKGDLKKGNIIKLSDSKIPNINKLKLLADDIKYYDNNTKIAEKMDAKGYKEEIEKYENADDGITSRVKQSVNGYEWSFYVNSTSYKIEFSKENNFTLTTLFGSNSGTYEVKKGYIIGTYSNGTGFEIPYGWKDDGDIDLKLTDGFDVRK